LFVISCAYAVDETECSWSGFASVETTDDSCLEKSSFLPLMLLLKNVVLYAFTDSDNNFLGFVYDLF